LRSERWRDEGIGEGEVGVAYPTAQYELSGEMASELVLLIPSSKNL
jgi:hypothetical protein